MKHLLVIIIFFMFPFCLFAQFSTGIKSSIPFFNANRPFGNLEMEKTNISDMGFFPIINAGVFVHYSFKNPLALQFEIKYTIEGLYYQIENMANSEDLLFGNISINYIEIPLLLQYKWGNRFNWFVQSGFSLKCLVFSEYFKGFIQNEDTDISIFEMNSNKIIKKLNNFVL